MSDKASSERSVAIIGMGCRFPGRVDTPSAFWELLTEGRDAIGTIPPDRMAVDRLYDSTPAVPGHIMSHFGGYLEGIDRFDAGFFHISPREAARMDPQQRLVLETAWEAMEDSGTPAAHLAGRRVGVFVGQWLSDFEMRLLADPEITDFEMTIGSGRYTTAGRVSHVLNLQGPSLTLDTACASSLTAVHLAVQSLRSGESEMAFAGGVNVILNPHITIGYSQAQMMAPDGHCKFCDASADGYVRSEGVGMLLLKRLDRALEDGDRIHAVIRGSAINNDGNTSGHFGRPSRTGQEALIAAALKDAGVAPGAVGYVEAHGTGTRTGDPEELAALAAVLSEGRSAPLRVGSVKTNIGHTEGAAGIAGLMKAVMAAREGTIPASLHFSKPNPAFNWAARPVEVAATRLAWDQGERIAGISGFGIAGSNAHVVIQNPPHAPQGAIGASGLRRVPILPLSADSEDALRALAMRHAERLATLPELPLGAYCAAAASRRSGLSFRAAFVAKERGEMIAELRRFGDGGEAALTGRVSPGAASGVIFVAPGQGGQWTGMARTLLETEPAFRDAIDACEHALAGLVDWSLTDQIGLEQGAPGWRLDRIEVIQPTLAALSIGYAQLWQGLGVRPDGIIGHSMGEVAAAAVSGRLSIADAMRVVVNRSALMGRTSGEGGMALVELVGDDLDRRLAPYAGRLCVGAVNSPRSCVVSGETAAIETFLSELEADGIFCRRIKVDVASHGPQMAALTDELAASLSELAPQTYGMPMYSTVIGGSAGQLALDAGYWARNLREPVRFVDAVGAALVNGARAFVELGPNPVLLASIEQILGEDRLAGALAASERRDRPADEVMAEGIATLWATGVDVDWSAYAPPPAGDVPLPLYPWQRQRYWHEAAELRATGRGDALPRLADDARSLLHEIQWLDAPGPKDTGSTSGQAWMVVGDGPRTEEVGKALTAAGATVTLFPLEQMKNATGGPTPDGIVVIAPDDDAGFVPLELLHAFQTGNAAPGRIVFVTQGATGAGPASARIAVGQAPLIGAARVIAEEHPELAIRLVDADPEWPLERSATEIAAEAISSDPEPEVALRGGVRRVPRLAALPEAHGPRQGFALRPEAAYLVTGGLSALGLRAAMVLVRGGARHLVLVSRRDLPPRSEWRRAEEGSETARRIAGVLALEAAGASVEIAALDVADEAALKKFVAARETEMRPEIAGVVHLATAYDTRLSDSTDAATFAASLGPKLDGARILDRLLPDLEMFVVYSSTMTFLPHQGLAGYAAANCGLDALAADRRARGKPALSIAWGPWKGLGRAALDHVADEFAGRGELSHGPEEGDAVLGWLLHRNAAQVSVFRMDWPAFLERRAGRNLGLFEQLVSIESPVDAGGPEFAALSPGERRKAAERFVPDAVCRVLALGTGPLDLDRPLGHLGLNSLMAIELRNALEKAVRRPLPATLAWSYPSARALIDHFAADTAEAPSPSRGAQPAAAKGELADELAEVAGMSDEDALAALLGGNG